MLEHDITGSREKDLSLIPIPMILPHSMHFYYTGTASDKYAGTYTWTVYIK